MEDVYVLQIIQEKDARSYLQLDSQAEPNYSIFLKMATVLKELFSTSSVVVSSALKNAANVIGMIIVKGVFRENFQTMANADNSIENQYLFPPSFSIKSITFSL